MRTIPQELPTGVRYLVHLGTGTVLDVSDGVFVVAWDDLGDDDRELLDSGHDSDAASVALRCGVPLSFELDDISGGLS